MNEMKMINKCQRKKFKNLLTILGKTKKEKKKVVTKKSDTEVVSKIELHGAVNN